MASTITPLTFTGISQFSSDFQTILSRAVSIAQLPVKTLQNQQTDVQQRKVLAASLQGVVGNLADSLSALGKLGSDQGLVGKSSDASKISINATNANGPASYTVSDITSIAQAASEVSRTGSASSSTPSSSGAVRLIVGDKSYNFSLGAGTADAGPNTLAGLRDAINQSGAHVTATILTTDTGDTPYYLSVTANQTGATTLRLIDDPAGKAQDLLTQDHQGANASFKLNGVSVDQSTNLVNSVVPGLSFTIQDTTESGETVTLSVASDRSQLTNALQNLVSTYNAVADQVNAQIGPQAGLLSGDWLIRDVQNGLRQIAEFQGSGHVQHLAGLGIEFSSTGQMSLNTDTLSSLSDSDLSAAFEFLGSATTGVGALANTFTQVSDPVTGLIKVQQDQYDATNQRLTDQIATLTERINSMQASLSTRLQAADSLIAQLQSQENTLTASIQALNYTVYGTQSDKNTSA